MLPSFQRLGWLIAVAALFALSTSAVWACDNPCPSADSSAPAPDYSAYWQAYQQWLQWQQKLYEDRKQAWIEQQERVRKDRLDRQLYQPPATEIWAAEPLNALLIELQKLQTQGTDLPEVALTGDMLKHANLTAGVSSGNVGLLKGEGKLRWPAALRSGGFAARRDHIEALIPQLVKQARAGNVDLDDLQEAEEVLEKTQELLRTQVARLSAPQYIEAKRFLNDLKAGFKVLGQPDAASHFQGDYAPQGETVAELIQQMTKKGLKFAPAAPADRAAYMALHRALASCAQGAVARQIVQ